MTTNDAFNGASGVGDQTAGARAMYPSNRDVTIVLKIISKSEAKARGLKRYFTGNPCSRGHLSERLVSDSKCIKCQNQKESQRTRTNRRDRQEAAKLSFQQTGIARTRREARERGLDKYWTGKPCKYGHVCERFMKWTGCPQCRLDERREVRPKRRRRIDFAVGPHRYYTGIPCKHGHLSERRLSDGHCLECEKIKHRTERLSTKRRSKARHALKNKLILLSFRTLTGMKEIKNANSDLDDIVRTVVNSLLRKLSQKSRAEAIALGLDRYKGRPCKLGHICERTVRDWGCVECKKLRDRRRKEQPAEVAVRNLRRVRNLKIAKSVLNELTGGANVEL